MGFWDSSQETQASSDVKPMERPDEFAHMFDEFMKNYFGEEEGSTTYEDMLQNAYSEEEASKQTYLDAVRQNMGTHGGLLDDLIRKQSTGEAVGPYGADIDRLLGRNPQMDLPWKSEMEKLLADDPRVNNLLKERTGISFGGGAPMQFMTGPQQRVISSLLGANASRLGTLSGERQSFLGDLLSSQSKNLETLTGAQRKALQDMVNMSSQRAGAGIAPAETAYGLFTPSNQANISYLQDLWDKIQPMETLRYGFPSQQTSSTTTGTPSAAGKLNWLGNAWDLATDVADWFT